jgi:hypothetical protein
MSKADFIDETIHGSYLTLVLHSLRHDWTMGFQQVS